MQAHHSGSAATVALGSLEQHIRMVSVGVGTHKQDAAAVASFATLAASSSRTSHASIDHLNLDTRTTVSRGHVVIEIACQQ
jgi:hypothetical protein